MNFLAHFHLAWPEEGLVVGALEGDYLKGPLQGRLPAGIESGVKLHRAIDAYTDQHPLMAELRRAFTIDLRRYAGILIDLSFDHYLSLHWARYSGLPLDDFKSTVYQSLDNHQQYLSPPAQRMRSRMREHDVLGLYGQWDTVPASAARIGQRFRRGNPFLETEQHLEPLRELLERAFLDFYPELIHFCETRKRLLN